MHTFVELFLRYTIYIRCWNTHPTAICINLISDSRPINLENRVLDTCHLESRMQVACVSRWPNHRGGMHRGGPSIMTMRIIFQKSHSSFHETNGHESRIRFRTGWIGIRASNLLRATFIHRARKGYNQFFEEEEEEETSLDFPSPQWARVKSAEGFRGKHMDGQLAHGSVHPVPS